MNNALLNDLIRPNNENKGQFDDNTIEFISEKINQLLDIPIINEKLEQIIIEAILKIIINLLALRSKV